MNKRIDKNGRLLIPAAYRQALGLKSGDELTLVLEDDELRVFVTRQAVARAQNLLRSYVPKGRSLSEELIRERRQEAAYA